MMKSSKNNHGFSLVELIIVIAIMAVLVGLLAPQYLKYVERARLQKALTNTKTVADAVTALLTDSAANKSPLYKELLAAISGSDTDSSHAASVNGIPAVKIDLSQADSDPLAEMILNEVGIGESITGIIYFYESDDVPSFSYEMQDGRIAVDYNPPADADTTKYIMEDGSYHVYYRD
jgi:type IV pilus assembly protein PilA